MIRRAAPRRAGLAFLVALLFTMSLPSPASAKPSQNDVFRSIEDNVSQSDGSGVKLLPWACAGAGVIIIMAIFSHRQMRDATPKPLNNHAKLLKEVMKTLPLKPRELKQLKIAAEEKTTPTGQPLCSPLVLLLSPTTLADAVQNRTSRADRQVLGRLIRRLVQPTTRS
ncbi:MAG TPA: hypothetical protein VFC78_05410 [Tepidisphaeraceae bacterium]|nr:hypothetical protein [Tepidisphaeraceae bacterium]